MKNTKSTKNALRTSILAFVLCFVMFVGTTFAWFTDSAIVNVNKIESGKLDIALEMYDEATGNWVNAESGTLSFKVADGTNATYWEPGASYLLPKLRVVNKGNLAAKFVVQVNGINGNAELNEAIIWTVATMDAWGMASAFGDLTAFCANEHTVLPDQSFTYQIQGTMRPTVGNDYQNLTIDAISVTILATQLSGVEMDSNGTNYDAGATYPGVVYVNNTAELQTALISIADGGTIYMNEGIYTTSAPFQIFGKSVDIIGVGNVVVYVTTKDTKAFYITSGVGADQVLDVKLANITVTTQYSSDRSENSSARGSIWLRTNSESPVEQHRGDINLTLDNVSAPSMQTDNNYDDACVFNVKLKNSTLTHWVNLEARHNSVPNHNNRPLDTYTNFKYDENSTVNGLMVQSTVADAAISHITINGVVPTEKGVVIPTN